jgi:hypothetical protein
MMISRNTIREGKKRKNHQPIIIASLLYIQWLYATSHHRLVDENLDPVNKVTLSRRLIFGILVYLIVIGISFVYLQLSIFLFTMILVPAFLSNKAIHRIAFGRSHRTKP